MEGKGKKRIMVVEDHPIFRLGLSELINQESDLFVCGEAEDVAQAMNRIDEAAPDMVIVDISLKGRNGIELVKELNRHYGGLPVLVLSMHDEAIYAERALLAGAKGYIMKQEASESIVQAIRSVLAGRIVAGEAIMGKILNTLVSRPHMRDKPAIERLTDRELEVFQFIGQGFSTKEIAEKLSLSPKTIGTYRERIKEKLNLKHAAELIRSAVHWVKHDRDEEAPE